MTTVAQPAAIAGTFSDLKTVKTRSVVQMIIEVPIERGAEIIAAFGFPRPGDEVPVAVARLDPEAVKHAPAASEKLKKRFHELPLSQQAALRCQSERFQMWLTDQHDTVPLNADTAAVRVREICGVKSRANFDSDGHGCHKWIALNQSFEQDHGLQADER